MDTSSITGWKNNQDLEEWKEELIEGDLLLKKLESTDYTEDNSQPIVLTLSEKVDKKILQEKLDFDSKLTKKGGKILVNTSKSRGEIKLLKYLINTFKWKEVWEYEGDVLWGAAGSEDSGVEIRTNRIPGMSELCDKKTTGYYLNKFREYFPEDYSFFPRTFLLPEQLEQFINFSQKSKKHFISKPNGGSQGDGIKLLRTAKDLTSTYNRIQNDVVVQHYISDPLLIFNKKFDFRIYVLISMTDPYIAYVHDEGLARFCAEEYSEKFNEQNFKNLYMHLTNYSLNKDHPEFKLPDPLSDIFDINQSNKRTLTSVYLQLKQMGHNVEDIKGKIEDMLVNFLTSMQPFILYNIRSCFQGKKDKCFQLLGFDILLDKQCKPWLLEVNANPSLNIEHELYSSDGTTSTEESPIDKYIKGRVVGDSIHLVLKSAEKQLDIGVGNNYRGFKQIVGGEIENNWMDVIKEMLEVYGKLSGHKFKGSITASRFVKLATYKGMTNDKLMKVDYDLMFKKLLCSNQTTQYMDFYNFIKAVEILASKLNNSYDPKNKLPAVKELLDNLLSQME